MNAVIINTSSLPKAVRLSGVASLESGVGDTGVGVAVNGYSVLPNAAGATLRPTTPASATMVSTYGIISTN